MLTLDYGGSPDTRSLCPLSLTTNLGGWDALCHESPVPWRRTRHPRASPAPPGTTPWSNRSRPRAAGSCAPPKLSVLTSARRQARAPRGFGHLLSTLAVCVQLGTA